MTNTERRAAFVAILMLIALGASSPNIAVAGPFPLTQAHLGDITTHFTNVQYTLDADPTTGTLTATGFPDEFDDGLQGFNSSDFTLSLNVARSTGQPLGGSIVIHGDTDGAPHFNGLLIQGDITNFNFAPPPYNTPADGTIFEFYFHVTGGLLAAPYYNTGYGGIIMDIANGTGSPAFTGVFTAPFHNNGFSGASDTFPAPAVPEPSSLVLWLGLSVVLFVGQVRRAKRMA